MDLVWQVVGWLIVLFIVYALAHTWLVRPFITLIERTIGREFFPYLDRLFPR